MSLEEALGRMSSLIAQHGQKRPLPVQLRGIAQFQQHVAGDAVNPHRRPARAFVIAQADHLTQQRDHLQLLEQHGVEGDLVEAAEDVARRARRAGTLDGIDLHQDGVARLALAHQRGDGRIAGIAAVPVGIAVDLDGLEHVWQAGRRQQRIDRQISVAEHPSAAGTHVGRGHEQLDRPLGQMREIDGFGEDGAQGIGPARVQVVGREQPCDHVHGQERGRVVQGPAPEQHIERAAPEGAELRGPRHPAPERLQRTTGPLCPALGIAVHQDGRIHGSGRRAGNAIQLKFRLFKQPVEHAPGKSSVGTASLQRKVHTQGTL